MLAGQQIVREFSVEVKGGGVARTSVDQRVTIHESKTKSVEQEEMDFGGILSDRRLLRFENRVRRQSNAVVENIFIGEREIFGSRTRRRVIDCDV